MGSGGLGKGPLPPSIQFKICSLISWWSRREFRKYIFEDPPPQLFKLPEGSGEKSPGAQTRESWLPCPLPQGYEGACSGKT